MARTGNLTGEATVRSWLAGDGLERSTESSPPLCGLVFSNRSTILETFLAFISNWGGRTGWLEKWWLLWELVATWDFKDANQSSSRLRCFADSEANPVALKSTFLSAGSRIGRDGGDGFAPDGGGGVDLDSFCWGGVDSGGSWMGDDPCLSCCKVRSFCSCCCFC